MCLVCGRWWLCVGEVPVWWVWPPPWALGVGLVLVLAVWLSAAIVVVHCFALFWLLYCVPPVPARPPARTSQCLSRQTPHRLGVCMWMHLVNGMGNSPSLGQPTPEESGWHVQRRWSLGGGGHDPRGPAPPGFLTPPQGCMLDPRPAKGADLASEGGLVWHAAMVFVCLPLAALIGLSPLHMLTLCGSELLTCFGCVNAAPGDLMCANKLKFHWSTAPSDLPPRICSVFNVKHKSTGCIASREVESHVGVAPQTKHPGIWRRVTQIEPFALCAKLLCCIRQVHSSTESDEHRCRILAALEKKVMTQKN